MNNKYKKKYIRTFIFVTISFLYLTVFDNDLCGSVNYSYDSDQTNIEVIYQPELPKEFQPYKGSYSFKQKKTYGSFYLENILKCRKKLLLSINKFSTIYLKNQNNYTSSFHHIILILQKSNIWHQSSDDDSFLNYYC
jgi:hypothetical protein